MGPTLDSIVVYNARSFTFYVVYTQCVQTDRSEQDQGK